MEGGKFGPRERSEEGCTCEQIFGTICNLQEDKHVYTWVIEGQIVYRVYTICSGENNVCPQVSSWRITHLKFLGKYRSIQADR
jgi:hypothetical protein